MSASHRRFYLPLGVVILALSLAVVACGDDDDDAGGDVGGTVDVVLSEFIVEPDPASAASGEVTFKLSNEGEDTHEFVVVKTDLVTGGLPVSDDGSVDEEGEGVEAIDEVEDIAAGTTAELTVTLEPGKYVLFCNLVEEEESGETEVHYQEGMHASFTVQ